jgi:hypothetical protein
MKHYSMLLIIAIIPLFFAGCDGHSRGVKLKGKMAECGKEKFIFEDDGNLQSLSYISAGHAGGFTLQLLGNYTLDGDVLRIAVHSGRIPDPAEAAQFPMLASTSSDMTWTYKVRLEGNQLKMHLMARTSRGVSKPLPDNLDKVCSLG